MNDQLLMENYLLVLKSTVEVYVHGTLESSNSDIRETLHNSLHDILDAQARTYDKMTEFGWYNVQNIESNQIQTTIDNLNKN